MPHRHSVYDTDPYFVLNEQTRVLTDKSATPTKIIQFDHNCERITFELPRKIDGHDMLECNSVQVHYINIDAATKAENKGVYEVTDLQQSADDENIAICSWLVSGNATQYIGALYFVVSFRCIGDDGTIEYNLNTARYDKLTVSTGINNTDYVAEEYADILAQWKAEIDAALAQGGSGGSSHEHDNKNTLDGFYCETSEYVPPEGDFPIGGGAVKSDRLTFGEHEIRYVDDGDVISSVETTDNEIIIHLADVETPSGVTIHKEPIVIPLGGGGSGDLSQFIEQTAASANLYPPMVDGWTDNASIKSDGSENIGSTAYCITPSITVKPETTYTVKPIPWGNLADRNKGRCYDANGTALAQLTWTINGDSATFTTLANTAYVRFSVFKTDFDNLPNKDYTDIEIIKPIFNNSFMLVEGTTAPEKYEPYGQGKYRLKDIEIPLKSVSLENVNNKTLPIFAPLAGKKIANFGDSIFGNARPPEDVSTYLAEKTGAEVLNCAFGGCRMAIHNQLGHWNAFTMVNLAQAIATGNYSVQDDALNYEDRTSYAEEPLSVIKETDFSTVDILTIAYGTNDFTSNIPLENAENPYDTATLAGALRTSIESLLTAYPNLKIFILSTMYRFYIDSNNEFTEDSNTRTNSLGLKLSDYNAKLKEVATEYNLPYVDDYNIGIGKFNRYQYFNANDGAHHKEEGRRLIAEHLAKELY